VDGKNTTPEDIACTCVPHARYVLQREAPAGKLQALRKRIRRRVRARIRIIKRKSARAQ